MEKPKKKPQGHFLDFIIYTDPFSFYSPYLLEECADLLTQYADNDNNFFPSLTRLLITLKIVDGDHYTFVLRKFVGRGLYVEVLGELSRDGVGTYVEAIGKIRLFTLIFSVFWLIILIYFITNSDIRFFAVFGLLIVCRILWVNFAERERMCRFLNEVLGKRKEE